MNAYSLTTKKKMKNRWIDRMKHGLKKARKLANRILREPPEPRVQKEAWS